MEDMSFPLVTLVSSYMTPLVYAVFFLTGALYIILSFILDYHWRAYGLDTDRIRMMRIAYFSASGIVITFMVLVLPGIFRSL
jgi:hypothetical protein